MRILLLVSVETAIAIGISYVITFKVIPFIAACAYVIRKSIEFSKTHTDDETFEYIDKIAKEVVYKLYGTKKTE